MLGKRIYELRKKLNVSTDYLLGYDIENNSCMEFIDKLK